MLDRTGTFDYMWDDSKDIGITVALDSINLCDMYWMNPAEDRIMPIVITDSLAQSMYMLTALVIGATGSIGSSQVRNLLDHEWTVRSGHDLPSGSPVNLESAMNPGLLAFVNCDVCECGPAGDIEPVYAGRRADTRHSTANVAKAFESFKSEIATSFEAGIERTVLLFQDR